MSVESLLKHVPENLRYYRQPIPDEQNALTPWREAVAQYVAPDEDDELWGNLVYGRDKNDDPDNESSSEPESVPFPTGAEAERIQDILDANRRAIELLDEGIALGRLQLPVPHFPLPGNDSPAENHDLMELIRVNHVRHIRAKAWVAQGDLSAAADDIIAVLRSGDIFCGGEREVTLWFVGDCLRKMGLQGIERLVEKYDPPVSVCRTLLAAVEHSQQQPDGLVGALCVELRYYSLPRIDTIPETENVERIVDAFLFEPDHQPLFPMDDELGAEKKAARTKHAFQRRRSKFLYVLQGHPRPFDKLATLELVVKEVGRQVEVAKAMNREIVRGLPDWALKLRTWWAHRQLKRQYSPWEVFPDCADLFGLYCDEATAEAELAQVKATGVFDDEQLAILHPANQQRYLDETRRRVQRVANPFGLYLANKLTNNDMYVSFSCRQRDKLGWVARLLRSRLG